MKLILILIATYVVVNANEEDSAKAGCKSCLNRCTPKGDTLDCPNDPSCLPCYEEIEKEEKVLIDQAVKELNDERNQDKLLNTVAALKRALKRASKRTLDNLKRPTEDKRAVQGNLVAMREAFKRASQKTSDVDEMVDMVKKDVGAKAFEKTGEELVKRWGCGDICGVAAGVLGILG